MHTRSRICVAVLVGTTLALAASTAAAGYETKLLTGSNYRISYEVDPAKWTIDDLSFAALVEPTGFFGTLKKHITFLGSDPFIIKFSQVDAPADYSTTPTGFKVRLDLKLTNGVADTKWTGFTEQLKDHDFDGVSNKTIDGARRGSTSHPLFAHLHPAGLDIANFKQSPFKQTNPADFDAAAAFTASDGEVATGTSWTASGLFLHAMDIKGLPRSFSLIETPVAVAVPESGTALLLAAGLAALLLGRRLQR